jgi:hypothetical protein
VDWIGLAKDRNRWRALVNSVLNLPVHEMLGNYRVASRVVLSSIELVSQQTSKENPSSCNKPFKEMFSIHYIRHHMKYMFKCCNSVMTVENSTANPQISTYPFIK